MCFDKGKLNIIERGREFDRLARCFLHVHVCKYILQPLSQNLCNVQSACLQTSPRFKNVEIAVRFCAREPEKLPSGEGKTVGLISVQGGALGTQCKLSDQDSRH